MKTPFIALTLGLLGYFQILRAEVTNSASMPSVMIAVDASFVKFKLSDIEALSRKSDGAVPDSTALKKLWQSGKGELVTSARTLGMNGLNVNNRATHELVYSGDAKYQFTTNSPSFCDPSFDWETREAGTVMNVTATIYEKSDTINLVIAPECSALAGWVDNEFELTDASGKKRMFRRKTPEFFTVGTSTSLAVKNNDTAVLGLGSTNDGKYVWYLFIRATIEK